MSKVIQMIITSDDNSLFICGFKEPNELSFRASRNPEHLQTEKIVIKDEMVFTNLYNFSILYLQKYIQENLAK